MNKINRRSLLKGMGISLAGGIFINGMLPKAASGEEKIIHGMLMPPISPSGKTRVVILGGGFSGLYCAKTLRSVAPDAEIVVVEKNPFFVSGPSHIDYIAGLKHLEDISRSYDPISAGGVKIIRSEAINVVADKNYVITAGGKIEYSYLLISTGIRIADEDVLNLIEQPASNSHAWELGESVQMRRRVDAFKGGKFVITVPSSPFKCPPGPYEVACLVREIFDKKKIKSDITIVDANDKPQPGPLAQKWTGVLDAKKINYMPNSKIVEIDPSGKKVITDKGEKVSYDLVSIIPPNKAATFIKDSGLGDTFVDVDPATFKSKTHNNVYSVGDCAKVPYTKSAYTAALQGRSVAHHIAAAMGKDVKVPDPIHNICYPYVSSSEALMISVTWDKDGKMLNAEAGDPKKDHARSRAVWENGLVQGLFDV